jgi:CHAT domain-containing protein
MTTPSLKQVRARVVSASLRLAVSLVVCAPMLWAQSADDSARLNALTDKFFSAFQQKDMSGMLKLWSARAPALEAFTAQSQQTFAAVERIELKSINVRAVEVDGAKATVRVMVEINALDAKTGKSVPGFGQVNRTLRFVKEDEGWKVWQYASSEEELASALVAAKTQEERKGLLVELKKLNTEEALDALLKQGIVLRQQGNYPQAFSIFQLAQEIAEQTNNKVAIARALNSIGNIYRFQGNYVQAMEYYQRSLALSKELGNKLWIAGALANIGNIHSAQGNYAQALEYYQQCLVLSEELGEKLWIAGALVNIGNLHFLQANYAPALEYFQKCLALSQASGDKGLISAALTNIGNVQGAQGNYTQALEYHRKSLALSEELDDKAEIARTLNMIGDIYQLQGSYAQALEVAERTTAVASQLASSELLWSARNLMGDAYRSLGNPDKARQAFADSIASIEEMRQQVVGGEQAQQRFFENKLAPYHGMIDLLVNANQPGEAFAYAERAKARVLLDVLRNGRVNITKTMSAQEQAQEHLLNNELTELNAQVYSESQRRPPDETRLANLKARRDKARLAYESFQTNLYVAHPELKVHRGQTPSMIRPEDAAAVLPDDKTALLEFVVNEKTLHLFVLTKAEQTSAGAAAAISVKVYTLAVTARQLATRIDSFRQMLAERNMEYQEPARQLYDLLIKPAEEQLRGKKTLCIVPDGVLWELPFQAVQSKPGVHLIEDYALFYVPSLGVLREMAKKGATFSETMARAERTQLNDGRRGARRDASLAAPTLLAFGNPQLNSQTIAHVKSVYRDDYLGPLPESEKEVKMLARLYGAANSKIFVGAAARESTAKAEAGKYRVIHFATHGVFDDNNPMYSHVTLSQAEGVANEDGLLEAREIINMDFRAELAVLSACQTARGKVGAGEGLIGMSWALFVAGIPTTVASQWKVDSASTTELMIEFHRRLTAPLTYNGTRMTKAEALRQAALTVMKSKPQTRHPFYWAGFVVIGNGW